VSVVFVRRFTQKFNAAEKPSIWDIDFLVKV